MQSRPEYFPLVSRSVHSLLPGCVVFQISWWGQDYSRTCVMDVCHYLSSLGASFPGPWQLCHMHVLIMCAECSQGPSAAL